MKKKLWTKVIISIFLALSALIFLGSTSRVAAAPVIQGRFFIDSNQNGRKEASEPILSVRTSDAGISIKQRKAGSVTWYDVGASRYYGNDFCCQNSYCSSGSQCDGFGLYQGAYTSNGMDKNVQYELKFISTGDYSFTYSFTGGYFPNVWQGMSCSQCDYPAVEKDLQTTTPTKEYTRTVTAPGTDWGKDDLWMGIKIITATPTPTPRPTPTTPPSASATPTPTPMPTPTPTPTTPPVTPATKTMIAGSSGTGGGVVSAATILNPTTAMARSQRLWVTIPYSGIDFPSYEELKDIYGFDNATTINQLSQISSPGRYKIITNEYIINPSTAPCKQLGVAAVVFIDGSLTIRKDFSDTLNNPSIAELLAARQNCKTATGKTTSPVFIVKNDINIDSGINNLYGIFYAGGTINTGSSSNRLYVFGNLLAKDFGLGRNLQVDNTNYPAEQIVPMPKYFLDLGSENLLGQTRITWRER